MCQKHVEQRFKQLIKAIRKRYNYNDFSMCETEGEIFLPTDLGVMISYLDKRFQKNQLKDQIKIDKINDISQLTNLDI